MRATRAHRDNRRSHHALQANRLSKCKDCGTLHLRHRLCLNCGKYRGRMLIDVKEIIAKKEKRTKEREKVAH
ncbi:MAG: 50S ribosomal protein L32 [Patescibacteria group bacterium]|nr:50S ribosomal protein L32 [Patescibacteria group bacterium]